LGIYFAVWSAYFVLHSLLASNGIKNKLGRPSWYRAFYTVFSLASLVPVFAYKLSLEAEELFATGVATKIPSLGLGLAAYFILRETAKVYDLRAFLGFKKAESGVLITDGILARMRHPLYTATVCLSLGFFLWSPTDLNLIMIVSWYAYLPVGIWFEERKLIEEFGDRYAAYKKDVPALFPKLKR